MKCLPLRLLWIKPDFINFPEPVTTIGRTQKERASTPIHQHGTHDFAPDTRFHESRFIQNRDIESGTAQQIRIVRTADSDHAAAG